MDFQVAEEELSKGGIAEVSMQGDRPVRGGYLTYASASFGHALQLTLRRQRLVLAAVISFLPVLIPLALAFLSKAQFADDGNVIFNRMAEDVHINLLAPLLALFFASMLIGEEVEQQTLPYLLTRPTPRSAWILGRFAAYLCVASGILLTSLLLTFAGCTSLSGLGFNATDLELLIHYAGVGVMGLLSYGSLTMLLGALTKRPIVIGVLLIYGWQRLALFIPGLIDFFTIQKFTDALLPILATQRHNVEIKSIIGTYNKEIYLVSQGKALVTLFIIAGLFIAWTVWTLRRREYASARAVGS